MTEMHKALFFGKVVRNVYHLNNGREFAYGGYHTNYHHVEYYRRVPEIVTYTDIANWKQFYSCDFEKPPLEIGEKVYINALDIRVVVVDRVRSTNGEYVYYVDYTVENIEDEKTAKSKQLADELLKRELERYYSLKAEKEKEIAEEPPEKKKWWQF